MSLPIPLRALKPRPKHKLTVPKEAHLGLTPGSPPANTTRPSGTCAGCTRGGTSALRVSSGALYPHLQHFKARSSRGKDGAPGRISPPKTPNPAARSCLPAKPARPDCKLQQDQRALPCSRFHCKRISASQTPSELPEGNAKKEAFGTTFCLPSTRLWPRLRLCEPLALF